MSKRQNIWSGEKDDEPDTEHSLFARLVEDVIVFVVCCFLVKLGVSYLVSVKIPLIILAVTLAVGIITYRILKRGHHDDY